jgi:secondary thiamine-phosphate synthase enzyme
MLVARDRMPGAGRRGPAPLIAVEIPNQDTGAGSVRAMWHQRRITLRPRPRGFHLVTREVVDAVPELGELRVGLAHLHLLHTSASLTLNENASPDVRVDFESWFDRAVPEDAPYWTHTIEGPDDMPAHIKASVLGPSLTLPVRDGGLALGTWQGVYLCEHRDDGGARSLIVTLFGQG